jgi:hypothetical protein
VRLRELARQRFPDDELAAEIEARELFNTEETAVYAIDLDAQVEEQGVLNTTRVMTRLQDELRDDLRAEGLGGGGNGNGNDDEYVHLDDLDYDFDADDLAYLELPTVTEATEATAEQRALMASFKTQHGDQSARRLMVAERRAAADRVVAAQQRVRHSAHRRNMATAREAR